MAKRSSRKKKSPQGDAGYVSAKYRLPRIREYVVAELKYESPVTYSSSGFAASTVGEEQAQSLNRLLQRFRIKEIRSHLGIKTRDLRRRVLIASGLPTAPSPSKFGKKGVDTIFVQSGFVEIIPKSNKDTKKLADALKRNKNVWEAYVAPRPVPAAVANGTSLASRNFEPAQGYLYSPPNGIGAEEVWNLSGAKGEKVTVCDIEGNWNLEHEDLPSGIRLLGGTPIDSLSWRNHGTAVLGEIVAKRNSLGCIGIAHKAKAKVHSAVINNVFNTAGAINNAANKLKAGDVILIELQATGPNGKYVAMQYWNSVFSAIVAATNKGITVVEAAGNGNENFDLPIFRNTGLQKDSGAIIVGAGVPPTNHFDVDKNYNSIGVPRSRIWFSNYGKIVNVQGWGWHVTTLGYGDAQGGASEKQWYTLRFSGTSSASPIVTGAVACLQGRSISKNGSPSSSSKIRKILMDTGTPQQPGPGVPLSQRIGALPHLPKAMKKI